MSWAKAAYNSDMVEVTPNCLETGTCQLIHRGHLAKCSGIYLSTEKQRYMKNHPVHVSTAVHSELSTAVCGDIQSDQVQLPPVTAIAEVALNWPATGGMRQPFKCITEGTH